MDGRKKRGFLVALRSGSAEPDAQDAQSAVLKLDVHDGIAAAARKTGAGELSLEAVQDLLDIHGELQKGAIFPDPRPESQILVGDKVNADAALYFLETLQVQQLASDRTAGLAFIDVVAQVNERKASPPARLLND